LGLAERKKQGKRKDSFAERNQRFRDAGRKSLKSLGREIVAFRGIVCFQWLDPLFRFAPIATAIPARMKRASRLCLVYSEKQ
jgi:hypothetical protein